jgi:hypothetical protein
MHADSRAVNVSRLVGKNVGCGLFGQRQAAAAGSGGPVLHLPPAGGGRQSAEQAPLITAQSAPACIQPSS